MFLTTPTLFVLHLEDDPLDAELIAAALDDAGFSASIVRVDNQKGFEAALESERPFDLVLADYSLPSFDGISALEILRARQMTTPFVFVSGALGDDLGIDSLKKGATDYVLKNKLERLAPSVARALREAEERAEREKIEDERERLVRIVQNSSDFIGLAGLDGRAFFVNEAGRKMIGVDEARVKELFIADCFMPQDRARVADELLPRILSEGQWAGEMQFLNAQTGKPVDVWWNGFVIRDPDTNEATAFATVTREITEQKQARAALAAALEKERNIAQTLQKSLLFDPPEDAFAGLSLGTLYEPAWDEAQIGGDFYDAFALEENKVALVVGDVTGKGLKAATYTAEVKFTLRAFLREHPDPSRALERLNNFLVDAARLDAAAQHQPREAMVALAVAVVDTISGETAFACGGSEPPLVLRADGSAHEVTARGLVIGANPKSEYEGEVLTLEPSDMVIMLTDGITEARRGRQFFDYEGMTQAAQAALPLGEVSAIGKSILNAAKTFAGGQLSDDVCLLLARRK